MEISFDASFQAFSGEEEQLFFDELIKMLRELLSARSESSFDKLTTVKDYLQQASDALKEGGINEEPAGILECFQIAEMAAELCTSFSEIILPDDLMSQLKDIFSIANDLFIGANTLCAEQSLAIPSKYLAACFSFVKSCQKLDIKVFCHASKIFLSMTDKNYQLGEEGQQYHPHQMIEFIQELIFTEYLDDAKRSSTSLKLTGILMRQLGVFYGSQLGLATLGRPGHWLRIAQSLIQLHAVYFDLADETLTVAYSQFVLSSFANLLQPLLAHESFLKILGCEIDIADLPTSFRAGFLCLVTNIFIVLCETKSISQTPGVEIILEEYLLKFNDWAAEETASQQWPWPVIGSIKPQTAHELCSYVTARFVLRSALEETSQFFILEQLLMLGLTGKSKKGNVVFTGLTRFLISDAIAFMAKSSQLLAGRYFKILFDFIARSAEIDDISSYVLPTLIRRLFDHLADDQKSSLVEMALEELVKSKSFLCSVKRAPTLLAEVFRVIETSYQTLISTTSSPELLLGLMKLFSLLAWWLASSPDQFKSSKVQMERVTFTMWQILSMVSATNDSSAPVGLLVSFTQTVFEVTRSVIIGINNQDASAKFWIAAEQFFNQASSTNKLIRELFMTWLIKSIDSVTLANSSAAQKIVEKYLLNEFEAQDAENESISLLHGVVLSNIANRLNVNSSSVQALQLRLSPNLRLRAEAFNQKLFCIPFSKIY